MGVVRARVYVCVTFIGTRFAAQAPPPSDKVWTEADWNTDFTIINSPYCLSKRLAEQAAFEFGREHGLDVVAINPSFIMGPPMSSRTDSVSVQHCISVSASCSLLPVVACPVATMVWLAQLLTGKYSAGADPSAVGNADVRDVARAHVLAMETPAASGRYIVSSVVGYTGLDHANALRALPEFAAFAPVLPSALVRHVQSPHRAEPRRRASPRLLFCRAAVPFAADVAPTQAGEVPHVHKYDRSKAERELGLVFTPIATTMADMARFLVGAGLAAPPSAS